MAIRRLRRSALLAGLTLVLISAAGGMPSPADQASLDQVKDFIERRLFADAEKASREALASARGGSDAGTVREAQVADLLVETLWRSGKGNTPEALDLALRSLDIKEKTLGSDHEDLAVSLRNLGRIREIRNEIPEAAGLYERSIRILETRLGAEAAEVGLSKIFLGNLRLGQDEWAEARSLFESSLAIYRKTGPPKRVASILHNLGLLCYESGDFPASRRFYDEALAIKVGLYGQRHVEVAWTLNGLANLTEEEGDFAAARSLYEQTLSIRREALGPVHLHIAWSLNNLANLLQLMGDYAGAAPLLDEALEIIRRAVGEDAPDAATTLSSKALLARRMGDLLQSRRLYEAALKNREATLAADDPALAQTLYELGALHADQADYAGAEALHRRALAIWESRLGDGATGRRTGQERTLAWSLNGLAGVLAQEGKLSEARALYERALAISEKIFFADHPVVADSLEGLAFALRKAGDLEQARAMGQRVVTIRQRTLGPGHPLTARAQSFLGALLAQMGEIDAALDASLAAERGAREHLRLTSRSLSDRQSLMYSSARSTGLDVALSLAAGGLEAGRRREVWECLLLSRALVLDEMASRRRQLPQPGRSAPMDALIARQAASSRRLANLLVKGPDPQDPDRHYRLLEEAQREKEGIDRDIAAMSKELRAERASVDPSLESVLVRMPRGSALVSYARYHPPEEAGNTSEYVAFVAMAGRSVPDVVRLGRGDEVDRRVAQWTTAVVQAATGVKASDASKDPSIAEGQALRRLIWDPLARRLGRANRLFIVPDGSINLVNLAALPDDRGGYLVESAPVMHYLSAERELLLDRRGAEKGEGLLILGGVAFDAPLRPAPAAPGGAAEALAPGRARSRGDHSSCSYFRDVRFAPLPGSSREVAEIADLWRSTRAGEGPGAAPPETVQLTGVEATEQAFQRLAPGRRMIHLATHGFYLDGRCTSATDRSRGIGGLIPASQEQTPAPAGENPLILSGLALAGANNRDEAGPDEEDGILTADEIAGLDLSRAQWVVLSACQTGVGEIRTGEGVVGLRRAFQIAGARTLIMSLWPVDDEATRQWMAELYAARIVRQLDTAEAMRQASLKVLGQRRKEAKATDPSTWAAFVASGDWR